MSKEQFRQWAMAVTLQVEGGKDESEQFAQMVEQHDKQAAALLRKLSAVADELSAHLQTGLDKQGS